MRGHAFLLGVPGKRAAAEDLERFEGDASPHRSLNVVDAVAGADDARVAEPGDEHGDVALADLVCCAYGAEFGEEVVSVVEGDGKGSSESQWCGGHEIPVWSARIGELGDKVAGPFGTGGGQMAASGDEDGLERAFGAARGEPEPVDPEVVGCGPEAHGGGYAGFGIAGLVAADGVVRSSLRELTTFMVTCWVTWTRVGMVACCCKQ
jgi:hypothetical protein